MFDARPLQTVTSVMTLLTWVFMAMTGLVVAALGLVADEGRGLVLGMGCCLSVGGLAFGVPVQALLRWSRTGKARPFLEDVAQRIGGGEVQTASLLIAMTSPRLEGSLGGYPFTLDLRRRAGILSPSEVGGGGLGWMYTLRVTAPVGAKIGFGPPGQTLGAGLIGLSNPVQANGMTVWTGGTPRGTALGQHLSTHDGVRWITTLGVILIVGPSVISVTGSVPEGLTPEAMSHLLETVGEVARIATQP